jgi:hypothetical protein
MNTLDVFTLKSVVKNSKLKLSISLFTFTLKEKEQNVFASLSVSISHAQTFLQRTHCSIINNVKKYYENRGKTAERERNFMREEIIVVRTKRK